MLANSGPGATHLVADIAGYFVQSTGTAGSYVGLSPSRLLDTRQGTGYPGKVQPSGSVPLQVAGRGGVPPNGAGAVIVNITVTEPAAPGFITAFPSGTTRPTASNLNFRAGQTVPNLAIVAIGADGRVTLTNASSGGSHLVVDVAGYFT
jgi:hypothetical protein